ncbi:hypothetical protein [uncultured Methylobacterium sp.]|uniref:hypothetical protein n=1 Tax=uncultured Methylobacterium sp. TaxID=157278 RepID=UPI0035C9DEF9
MCAALLKAIAFEAGLRMRDGKVLVRAEAIDLAQVVATAAFQSLGGPSDVEVFRHRRLEVAKYLASYAEEV